MKTVPHGVAGALALALTLGMTSAQSDQTWTDQFGVDAGELVSRLRLVWPWIALRS